MATSVYRTPDNVVELLDGALGAALKTRFYRSMLGERRGVGSLRDFEGLPVTPIAELRRQALADVVAEPDRVGWIFGRRRGRRRGEVAVAEGAEETALRYSVFRDALKDALPARRGRNGVALATPDRRYFAAEVATMLGYAGVATHVVTDRGDGRAAAMLRSMRPDVLAMLAGDAGGEGLPPPGELWVTVRGAGARPTGTAPRLDVYMVDELGLLGHSTDGRRWTTYNDLYYYELSRRGRLVVTALRSRAFPLLRIETEDEVRLPDGRCLEIARLVD